jgi:hypothetical protein
MASSFAETLISRRAGEQCCYVHFCSNRTLLPPNPTDDLLSRQYLCGQRNAVFCHIATAADNIIMIEPIV